MKKISVVTILVVVSIWAGSAMAHSILWSPSTGGNDFVWDITKKIDFSSYWLGQHQIIPQAIGQRNWAPDEPDNGIGEAQTYLQYWPRDSRWNDMENRSHSAKNFFESNPIPEPATMLLLGMGLLGLARNHVRRDRI